MEDGRACSLPCSNTLFMLKSPAAASSGLLGLSVVGASLEHTVLRPCPRSELVVAEGQHFVRGASFKGPSSRHLFAVRSAPRSVNATRLAQQCGAPEVPALQSRCLGRYGAPAQR